MCQGDKNKRMHSPGCTSGLLLPRIHLWLWLPGGPSRPFPPLSPSSPSSGFSSHQCLLSSLFSNQIPKSWDLGCTIHTSAPPRASSPDLDLLSDSQMSCMMTIIHLEGGGRKTPRGRQAPINLSTVYKDHRWKEPQVPHERNLLPASKV